MTFLKWFLRFFHLNTLGLKRGEYVHYEGQREGLLFAGTARILYTGWFGALIKVQQSERAGWKSLTKGDELYVSYTILDRTDAPTHEKCVVCNGTGHRQCQTCHGKGEITPPGLQKVRCHDCKGTKLSEEKCHKCQGEGETYFMPV
jgi:hypothetical protein